MASFPAIENCSVDALLTATKNSGATWSSNNLGDGYSRLFSFGLNPVESSWSLSWEVSPADANTIDAFLQARGDDGDKFQWQPPDEQSETDWQCRSWVIEQISHNWSRVRATFERVHELAEDLVSESLVCDPQALPPITGYWFRYANGFQTTRRQGIAGFADTDNSIYGLGININTTYHYVGKIDADTAVATWNKRYSYSDSGTFLMNSQYTESSVVDDENGTDGTVSLFSHKAGTSSIRIYRVVISKVDGSVVNTFTAEINVLKDSNFQPCVVRKVGENYIVFILARGNVPNPCGGVLNQTVSTLMGSFTSTMSCNWLNILGTASQGLTQGPPNDTLYDTSVFPKGNEPRRSSSAIPFFFDSDNNYIYLTNGDRSANTNSGYGNHYLRVSIATGAAVDGPGAYLDPDSGRYIMCKSCSLDSDGNVYTDAGSSLSLLGNVDIIKWSSDVPSWYRNYGFGGGETSSGQKLLERDGKILLVYPIQYSTGEYEIRLCLVDKSDGSVIPNSGKIINWDTTFRDIEPLNLDILPMANTSGALIVTQVGTYVRIDVNNLPAAGSYPTTNPAEADWLVTDLNVTSSTKTTTPFISTSPRVYCGSLPGVSGLPTVFNVLSGVTLTNPTVTVTAEDNPTFGIDYIGGYYSS